MGQKSDFSWTVLGAGTAVPHAHLSPSGHLLRFKDTRILIDMGAGTLWRLAAQEESWVDLDAVCLSHRHLDHTLDLQALMFAARIPGHGRKRALPVHMGPGMKDFVGGFKRALGKWMIPKGFEVVWCEHRGDESFDVGPLRLQLARVAHDRTSVGMRFTAPGGLSVVYSGDSDYCEALVELCVGASLAVLECSTGCDDKIPGHMSPREVARLAVEAELSRVVLVHTYPSLDGVDLPARVADYGFKGLVQVARDGLRLEI